MEYLKDFDFDLKYHQGKANVVADALSRKALARAEVSMHTCELYEQVRDLNLTITEICEGLMLQKLEISCDLRSRIVQTQSLDANLKRRIGNPKFPWLQMERFCVKVEFLFLMIRYSRD